MNKDVQQNIGKALGPEWVNRDAIHVAVIPMVVARDSEAGDHVGINKNGELCETAKPLVGIVDPFIDMLLIPAGTKVWLFLYPNMVTGMRHHWSHPTFDDLHVPPKPNTQQTDYSEAYLKAVAINMGLEYGELLASLQGYITRGHPIVFSDERPRDEYFEQDETEFWSHVERVLGVNIPKGYKALPFSCSC